MADYTSQLKKTKIPVPGEDLESQGGQIDLSSSSEQASQGSSFFGRVFSKVKGYARLNTSENAAQTQQKEKSILKRIASRCEIEKSYSAFFIFLFLGIGIVLFSFFFLPMVILSPQKFVSLFSVGSLTTVLSFIFYYGTYDFLLMLFNKERRWFSVAFFASIFLGLYLTFFTKAYFIFSLMCSGIQMFVMIMFLLSFIPGGQAGINMMISMVYAPVKRIFRAN